MERYHANYNYENTGVTIVTSGKIDFKIFKNVTRDEKHYYILKNGSNCQVITIITIYAIQ